VSRCEEFRRMELAGRKRIVEIGSKRIEKDMTVMTHCHSSTVFNILNVAKNRDIRVICTETRPKYQGRTTAKELLDAGIPTTMIVDSAARHYMNKVDMVLVGADVINNDGSVINKIGSSTIALCADEARTDFYCAATIMKFDPETVFGPAEEIEQRTKSEVWDRPPKGLKILNPAFDMVPREYIEGIITESGIFAPSAIYDVVRRDYNWIFGGF
jgi:ribose 1,5-bisphosphate isomerase